MTTKMTDEGEDTNMTDNTRRPDGAYMKRLLEQREDEFIEKAVKSLNEGKTWERFLQDNPQYTLAVASGFHTRYEQMKDRRAKSKKGTWGLEAEMQTVKAERRAKGLAEGDQRQYEGLRDELVKMASEHCGWQETKRRMQLTDAEERYFRRAQAEAGVTRYSEKPDPMDEAFALGFFG